MPKAILGPLSGYYVPLFAGNISFQIPSDILALLSGYYVPLFAGNISFLFALMTRNTMVSGRIREACIRLASEDCNYERGQSLKAQIDAFLLRYASNKKAIVSVLFAIGLLILDSLILISGVLRKPNIICGAIFFLSVGCTLYTLFRTIRDFWVATETLEKEVHYSTEIHNRRIGELLTHTGKPGSAVTSPTPKQPI